jgi:hypothetical protein
METERVETPAAGTEAEMPVPEGPVLPPVRRSPGLRPAMIVLGIAAGILVLFGVLAAVSGQGTDKPTAASGPASVKGTSLLAVPAARALKPIERPGTPPDNIVDALTLPQGSVAGTVKDDNTSATQYDEQMQFSVKASEATVVDFYKAQLKTDGWSTFSVGPATDLPGGVQVLAQKGGTDGWYWEVGAIVSPTTFAPTSGTDSTRFTLRLFQEPDDD